MLAKTLKRAGLGFFIGVFVGNVISALFGWPDYIVSEKLLTAAGGLSPALLLQTLLSGALGAVSFAGVSFYEIERWPLLLTAAVHYLVIEATYLSIAFILGWLETARQALIWALLCAAAYLIIFLIMWAIYRSQVKELNEMQTRYRPNNLPQKDENK